MDFGLDFDRSSPSCVFSVVLCCALFTTIEAQPTNATATAGVEIKTLFAASCSGLDGLLNEIHFDDFNDASRHDSNTPSTRKASRINV